MKNQKGITLVALIITIIIMIILAGVAMALVMGDEGVINKAENAGAKQSFAVAEEKIKAQSEYITQGENAGKVDLEATQRNITGLGLNEVKETKIEGNILKVTLSDNSVVEIVGVNSEIIPEYDVKYYMSGISNADSYVIFYNDGTGKWTEGGITLDITYDIENNVIKGEANYEGNIIKHNLEIVKEQNNNILLVRGDDNLLATSTSGLKYFNGEEYIYEEDGIEYKIILGKNESHVQTPESGGTISCNEPTVFYKGQIYSAYTINENGNITFITSNDNCETLTANGHVYRKIIE